MSKVIIKKVTGYPITILKLIEEMTEAGVVKSHREGNFFIVGESTMKKGKLKKLLKERTESL